MKCTVGSDKTGFSSFLEESDKEMVCVLIGPEWLVTFAHVHNHWPVTFGGAGGAGSCQEAVCGHHKTLKQWSLSQNPKDCQKFVDLCEHYRLVDGNGRSCHQPQTAKPPVPKTPTKMPTPSIKSPTEHMRSSSKKISKMNFAKFPSPKKMAEHSQNIRCAFFSSIG